MNPIVLITPANIEYMPYLKYYTDLFDENEIEYIVLNWDRLGIEKK